MLKNKNCRAGVGALGGLALLAAGAHHALQIFGAEMDAALADSEVQANLPYGERNALLLSAFTCLTLAVRQRMAYITELTATNETEPTTFEDTSSANTPSDPSQPTISLVKVVPAHKETRSDATIIDIQPRIAQRQQQRPPDPYYPDGSGGLSSVA